MDVRTMREHEKLEEMEIAFYKNKMGILEMFEIRRGGERIIKFESGKIIRWVGTMRGNEGLDL